MTNNELLLAISNMIDTKFEAISAKIDKRFEAFEKRLDTIEKRLDTVEKDIKDIKFTLENEIEPRLQNIENCYLTTFERYQAGVEQIDSMQMDVNILKKVVEEHSKTLEKLA